MSLAFGDMFKNIFSVSEFHAYLFVSFYFYFLDLNIFSKWNLFLV